MLNKETIDPSLLENKNDSYYVTKKVSIFKFLLNELLVFLLISTAVYFSIFISSKNFTSKESFYESFTIIFDFFTVENLIYTTIGILIVIGAVCVINKMVTDSALNIQPTLDRLIVAIVDFYYLMFSTILGCMIALLHFNSIEKSAELGQLISNNFVGITVIGSVTILAFQFFVNQKKIIL